MNARVVEGECHKYELVESKVFESKVVESKVVESKVVESILHSTRASSAVKPFPVCASVTECIVPEFVTDIDDWVK